MLNVNFEVMENKIRIILERARDGVEPLEDLEQELLNLYNVSGRIPLGTKVKTVQGDKTITNNAQEFGGEPAYRCDWNTEELWITSDFIKVYDR